MRSEFIDDWILLQEDLVGKNLVAIDDRALQQQNRAIEMSRFFIPD